MNAISYAIDGEVSTDYSGFFSSDNGDNFPWLQVELDDSYLVMQVDVYNRKDNVSPTYALDFEFIQVSQHCKLAILSI